MGRHASATRSPVRARSRLSRGALVAAAVTPMALFGIGAPALADTGALDAGQAAGSLLGLPGDTPVVDIELPDVCLDLNVAVQDAEAALEAADGDDPGGTLAAAVANAKVALGDCVEDNTPDTTPTTPPSSTSPTPPSSTSPLPPPLGGTGGTGDRDCSDFADRADAQRAYLAARTAAEPDPLGLDRDGDGLACEVDEGSSTDAIGGDSGSGDGSATPPSVGSGQIKAWPTGAPDTGDGSFPTY